MLDRVNFYCLSFRCCSLLQSLSLLNHKLRGSLFHQMMLLRVLLLY
jgi:hypothetical protein